MIAGISHITLICRDLERSGTLFREVFDAVEIYSSEKKNFSISKERFYLIRCPAARKAKDVLNDSPEKCNEEFKDPDCYLLTSQIRVLFLYKLAKIRGQY